MNERQRQAYLQVMGIQTLYPRRRVAGARPSPAYDYPVQETAAADAKPLTETQAQATAGSGVMTSLRSRLTDLPGTEARRKPALAAEQSRDRRADSAGKQQTRSAGTELQAAPGAEKDVADYLRFKVNYLQFGQQLAVLQEVPWQTGDQNNTETEILLRNILLALDLPVPEQLPRVEVFNWPLSPDMPDAEATREHAAQALGGFIAMRRQRDGFANLLVFTAQLQALLTGADQSETSADFHWQKLNCHITSVTSLQAMLAVPALKKEVWQQLQPLRTRLQAK